MHTKPSYPQLYEAAQGAKLRVAGHQEVTDFAHAEFMTALIRVFGESAQGFIYAEPLLTNSDYAPDIVLAHPQTGVIVFEVKAYDLEYIQGSEAGNLNIRRGKEVIQVNPMRQAQRSMYAVKEGFEQLALDFNRPLFNAMVALPNISEREWMDAGYDGAVQRRVTLFAEDCANLDRLQTRIARHVHQTLNLSGLAEALPSGAESTLSRVFGSSALLNKPKRPVRPLHVENLGAQIDAMEAEHRQLSVEQQGLIQLDTWGHPFLLRGVAGSGKSIVLAYHAAWAVLRNEHQHQQLTLFEEDRHAMPKIAVVCVNRSFIPYLREMIEASYREISGRELPPDAITVVHLNGLFFQLAQEHDFFHYLPAGKSRDMARQALEYQTQLDSLPPARQDALRFDAMYIDEGQDIHPEMFLLLYSLVRPNRRSTERSMSIFYDDAQNIYGYSRPTWSNFGLNVEGGRAAFMRTCYRNSQEIIELGLNVLLGTAADEKIRVKTRRYADIYTLKEKELVAETPQGWRVFFAESSGIIPQVRVFPNRSAQTDWVAAAVINLIEEENVRPEDILVLAGNASPFTYLEQTIRSLSTGKIEPRIVGGKNRALLDEPLIVAGQLTLSTIYASKGYDAPIVILMDVELLDRGVIGRSMFYVGVTRAKRYLIVTGVKRPRSLLSEAQSVHHDLFEHEG